MPDKKASISYWIRFVGVIVSAVVTVFVRFARRLIQPVEDLSIEDQYSRGFKLSDGEPISDKEMTELIARFRKNHAIVRKTAKSGKSYGAWLDTHFSAYGYDFVKELHARGGYGHDIPSEKELREQEIRMKKVRKVYADRIEKEQREKLLDLNESVRRMYGKYLLPNDIKEKDHENSDS
ncbi:hypothetical protein FACS1894170_10320 [Planctomycetales bacterium]|nr:hypothetical protein FACS1894170_10320 [Planctomycetales bacterium]